MGGQAGFPLRSKCWRFDRYEVTDGSIHPYVDASLEEYDPFDVYRRLWDREGKAKKRSLGNHPPYVELMHLTEKPDDSAAITQWCSRYGLLGLLPFRTVQLVQPPSDVTRVIESPLGRRVEIELDEMLMDSLAKPANAIVHTKSGDIVNLPLSEALVPYFPSVEDISHSGYHLLWGLGAYGHHDVSVLRYYAEPVQEFLNAASELRRAFGLLSAARAADTSPPDVASRFLPPDYGRALGSVWEDLVWVDGSWRPSWQFSSLLAALYTMLRLDVGGGKVQRYCKRRNCGRPFITANPQQEYCSEACVRAEEKARERARKKWVDERIQDEFQHAAAVLEQQSPGAYPDQRRRLLRHSGSDVIDALVREVKQQYPSCHEEVLWDRAWQLWKCETIRKYGTSSTE